MSSKRLVRLGDGENCLAPMVYFLVLFIVSAFVKVVYYNIGVIPNWSVLGERILKIVPGLAICCAVGLIWKRLAILYYVIYLAILISSLILLGHIHLFGVPFNAESAVAVLVTNFSEASQFVRSFVVIRDVVVFCVIAVFSVMFLRYVKKGVVRIFERPRVRRDYLLGFIVLALATGWINKYRVPLRELPFDELRKIMSSALADLRAVKELEDGADVEVSVASDVPRVLVLVIGESINKHHMGVYGYYRDTTPRLNSIDEKIVWKNVVSAAPTTFKSVGMMLTLRNLENDFYGTTVLRVAQKAGYKTWWLSSQGVTQKLGHGIVNVIANDADATYNVSKREDGRVYDGDVLPPLRHALKDPATLKFIVIHTLGSHTAYAERVPPEWNGCAFGEPELKKELLMDGVAIDIDRVKSIVNAYDCSVLYTDYVLFQIWEEIKKQDIAAGLFFVGDHGEEVFDSEPRFGHAGSAKSRYVYEVPMIFLMNSGYREFLGSLG
ncbi:MAG: hypothetical protein D6732_10550, partial [Methanobacteriota archaeon]